MRQFAAVVVAVAATTAAAQVTLSGSVGQAEEGPVAPTPCCTAALVPAGHFELETNYSGDTAGSSFVHTSNLMLKYSLTDRIQVQVGTPNFLVGGVDTTRHSFDGLNVGVKYLVFDEGERRPALAVSAHLVFPTWGDAGFQSTFDVQGWVYATKTFGSLVFDATVMGSAVDFAAPRGGASLTAT
ncbi:MAG: hypothetical protein ACOZQL_11795 [Myxococcota bacterium]